MFRKQPVYNQLSNLPRRENLRVEWNPNTNPEQKKNGVWGFEDSLVLRGKLSVVYYWGESLNLKVDPKSWDSAKHFSLPFINVMQLGTYLNFKVS